MNENLFFPFVIFALLQIEGEQWRILRQKMTTTFSSGKIKGMMPTLMKISDDLVEVIDEMAKGKQCINYRDFASRYMCDIIGQVAFGLECNVTYANSHDEHSNERVCFF
jgi:cytochrome P450 family 6